MKQINQYLRVYLKKRTANAASLKYFKTHRQSDFLLMVFCLCGSATTIFCQVNYFILPEKKIAAAIPYPIPPLSLAGETVLDLIVEERQMIRENSFLLYQNHPNPFIKKTAIKFDLLEATSLSLTIYNANGSVLKEYKGLFEKGPNQIDVSGEDLKEYGVLYYQMTTPNQILSKKMIYRKEEE